jgi:hypothetical protein
MATNTMADLSHTAEPDCRELDWNRWMGAKVREALALSLLLLPFPSRRYWRGWLVDIL